MGCNSAFANPTIRFDVFCFRWSPAQTHDLDGTPHLVGRLWLHNRKRVESATFRYDEEWLRNPERFALEPALQMDLALHHTTEGKSLFGAIGDSTPDRWGRALMMRSEARRARTAGEPPRTLWDADYLLLVDDETRQGALRFASQEGGPFLREIADHRTPHPSDFRLRANRTSTSTPV